MDKLEHYLDQVCRGIAGPRSLRQHIRQELREHLNDAIAEHVAAGMSEAEALGRALDDFGGPSEVRAELEATHGHRALAVIIDKAMQWKERTMKAKWFWSVWAHLAVVLLIAGEIAFLSAAMVFVVPKFLQLSEDQFLSEARDPTGVTTWAIGVIRLLFVATHWEWLVVPIAAAWAIFEWRVRSDHKSLIRLAILGTMAVGLLVEVAFVSAAISLPFMIHMPNMRPATPQQVINEQLIEIDQALAGLDDAKAKADWMAVSRNAGRLHNAVIRLSYSPVARPALSEKMQQELHSSRQATMEMLTAAANHDSAGLDRAIQAFRNIDQPLRAAATMPAH